MLAPIQPDGVDGGVDRGEDLASVTQETFARREQGHSAGRSREKRGPELVLEGADLAAQGWLRDVEALGGAADVPFLGDGNEVADLRETHGFSMRRTPRRCKIRRQIETVLDPRRSPAAKKQLR